MARVLPADAVLIERGKYATLASERRALLKALRDDMETIVNAGRRVMLCLPEDVDEAAGELFKITERLERSQERMLELCGVVGSLESLRPLAWGKETYHE